MVLARAGEPFGAPGRELGLIAKRTFGRGLQGSPLAFSCSVAALGLIVVGFALRLFRLSYQSLWFDEAQSLYVASQPIEQIPELIFPDHVPLYYLLLKGWVALAGDSEFSLRFLSLMLGLLILPVLYVLGRRLLGQGTALTGLVLAAASPALVYYSQETRMYSLATLLGAISFFSLIRLFDEGGRRWWLGYALSTAGAWYSHYLALLLVPAQGVYALHWAGRWVGWRRPGDLFRRLWPFASALLLACLLWLPWLSQALSSYPADTDYFPGTLDLAWAVQELVTFLGLGWFAGEFGVAAFLFLPLVLGGAIRTWRNQATLGLVGHGLLILYLVVPLAIFFAVAYQRPKFSGHYLLFVSPAYLLLTTHGLMGLLPKSALGMGRGIGLAHGRVALFTIGISFLLSMQEVSLINYYFDPAYARDDWRAASSYLEHQRQDGDRVVLVSSHAFTILQYYYRGGFDGLPESWRFSIRNRVRRKDAVDLARSVKSGHLWLVLWQDNVVDPNGTVVAELDRRLTRLSLGKKFGPIAILAYSAQRE